MQRNLILHPINSDLNECQGQSRRDLATFALRLRASGREISLFGVLDNVEVSMGSKQGSYGLAISYDKFTEEADV